MGRTVWITGASTGIGRSLALKLAADGDTVAASARSPDTLEELAGEAAPGRILPFPVDVTDAAAVAQTAREIESTSGPIDLAILNAGTYTPTPATGFDAGAVARMMSVNVVGVANALAALMPRMMERRRGRLALMASVAGYRGLPRAAGYSASKAAVIAMGQSLKTELDGFGVKVQVICPGFVKTPLTAQNAFPMPFLMEVDDAAARIIRGLETSRFEIAFPQRFALQLKLMQKLPDCLYFPLIRKATGL